MAIPLRLKHRLSLYHRAAAPPNWNRRFPSDGDGAPIEADGGSVKQGREDLIAAIALRGIEGDIGGGDQFREAGR